MTIASGLRRRTVAATIAAIQDANIEVEVGGSPVYQVRVLSVTDNYRPDKYGLNSPPTIRFLTVRLQTAIPPMFHQGKDEVTEESVWVHINNISSEGDAKVRAHMQPLPVAGQKE